MTSVLLAVVGIFMISTGFLIFRLVHAIEQAQASEVSWKGRVSSMRSPTLAAAQPMIWIYDDSGDERARYFASKALESLEWSLAFEGDDLPAFVDEVRRMGIPKTLPAVRRPRPWLATAEDVVIGGSFAPELGPLRAAEFLDEPIKKAIIDYGQDAARSVDPETAERAAQLHREAVEAERQFRADVEGEIR